MSNGHWPFHLKVNGTVLKNAMVSSLVINQQLGEHTLDRYPLSAAR